MYQHLLIISIQQGKKAMAEMFSKKLENLQNKAIKNIVSLPNYESSILMPNTPTDRNLDWIKILNGVALLLCSICLVFITVSLRPVAKWATNQNICVEQEMSKSNAPVSWGVRKCNGRSKVYKVMEKSAS